MKQDFAKCPIIDRGCCAACRQSYAQDKHRNSQSWHQANMRANRGQSSCKYVKQEMDRNGALGRKV